MPLNGQKQKQQKEDNKMRRKVFFGVIGAGLVLTAGSTPEAHADVFTDAATDHTGISATCTVFREQFTGNPSSDISTVIGVGSAIAEYYGLSMFQAGEVEALQVRSGCPELLPELRAAVSYAMQPQRNTIV